jgi:hypothetical protein
MHLGFTAMGHRMKLALGFVLNWWTNLVYLPKNILWSLYMHGKQSLCSKILE